MNLQELKQKYGSVTFEGREYILASDADFTNRLLDYPSYQERDEEGGYNFEMSSRAYDADDNEIYEVYWIFYCESEEAELDSYDYSDDKIDRVEALS